MFLKTKLMIVFSFLFITLFASTSYAADYTADARYRSGGWPNDCDHAGLRKLGVGVYEIRGPYTEIQLSSWEVFLDSKTYLGAFINPTMTSTDRTNILNTAAAMDADPDITYTALCQVDYDMFPGDYIEVSEISDIRCDGVVEYAYEWNNVWIWGKSNDNTSSGTPTNFDVSYENYCDEHDDLGYNEPWIEVSPRVQRGNAGTKWTQLRQYF